MNTLIACWKLSRITLHIAQGLITVILIFPTLNPSQKKQRIQTWAKTLLTIVAIKVVVLGHSPRQGPVLLAANHISWLDVYLMLATCPSRFVAKAEVRQWPLIGMLAQAAGTLFIRRESPRDALRVVHHMAQQLQAGEILAIFPEGTSSNGLQVLPFHANLFQAAIAAEAPVQPLALQFSDAASGQLSHAPCYIDNDTLLESIWRTLKAPALCATITYGKPHWSQGQHRRDWASQTHSEVVGLLRANGS
jgi:1-acyl-sn-glycerol-3-phosphate acyltransferase